MILRIEVLVLAPKIMFDVIASHSDHVNGQENSSRVSQDYLKIIQTEKKLLDLSKIDLVVQMLEPLIRCTVVKGGKEHFQLNVN